MRCETKGRNVFLEIALSSRGEWGKRRRSWVEQRDIR